MIALVKHSTLLPSKKEMITWKWLSKCFYSVIFGKNMFINLATFATRCVMPIQSEGGGQVDFESSFQKTKKLILQIRILYI